MIRSYLSLLGLESRVTPDVLATAIQQGQTWLEEMKGNDFSEVIPLFDILLRLKHMCVVCSVFCTIHKIGLSGD